MKLGVFKMFRACYISVSAGMLFYGATANADFGMPFEEHVALRVDAASVGAVDGDNTAGTEYTAAERENAGGSTFLDAQVFFKRVVDAMGNETLRIYFSVNDESNPVTAPLDSIGFYFDELHNHGTATFPSAPGETLEDVEVMIFRNDCGHGAHPKCSADRRVRSSNGTFEIVATSINFTTDAAVKSNAPGEYTTSLNPLGWTGEFELTPADLGWSTFPPIIGLLVHATSENQNNIGAGTSSGAVSVSYPFSGSSVVTNMAAGDWSNFKFRYPIDFALVLDYSGSMLSNDGLTENRWSRAKRAADLFISTLGLFKRDTVGDRVSASQYSWSCSGNDTSGDTTGPIAGASGIGTGLVLAPNAPVGPNGFITNNAVDPPGNNCTPIQRGVEFALNNQLQFPTTPPKRDRVTILLSDGFHNMPPMNSGFRTAPGAAFNADQQNFMQVNTVALGPDGSAGTQLLDQISDEFTGSSFDAKYNNVITGSVGALFEAYLSALEDPFSINQVDHDGLGKYSPGAPDKLVFIGVWNDPTSATALQLELDNSPFSCSSPSVSIENTKIGYAACIVDNPSANGLWEFAGTMPDYRFVLADLRIAARYLVEQGDYSAGEPILLRVRLTDNGQPLVGAEASVEEARPGEGLGNYLSTVQKDCSFDSPPFPGGGKIRDPIPTNQGSIPGSLSRAATSTVGDPPSGRYALAANHFDRCQIEGLERKSLPGLKLFDDGTNGDTVAGDGIYTRLIPTDLEGTYTFRFHIRGTAVDGIQFARTKTISEFVRIKSESDSSETVVRQGGMTNGNQNTSIYVLPRDPNGNYLGPGFDNQVHFKIKDATPIGGVQDLRNGIYGQGVKYNPRTDRPVVTPVVQGQEFDSIRLFKAFEVVPFIGATIFDNSLNLDNSVVFGAKFNYWLLNELSVGIEAGVTPTDQNGNNGAVVQLFGNLQYAPRALQIGPVQPFFGAGLGGLFFTGFANDDEAFAYHFTGGITYDFSESIGLLAEGRLLRTTGGFSAGATNNGQFNVGLVFRF